MKAGCLIVSVGDEYRKIGECAVNSFKKFHPDVTLHLIDEKNIDTFECNKSCSQQIRDHFGIFRYAIAAEIMEEHKYDKLIILGADTITCGRMSEFLENDGDDVSLTSDYGYQPVYIYQNKNRDKIHYLYPPILCLCEDPKGGPPLGHYYFGHITELEDYSVRFKEHTGYTLRMIDYLHASPEVCCFHNLDALKDVYKCTLNYWESFHEHKKSLIDNSYSFYAEQGGINIFAILSIAQAEKFPLPIFQDCENPAEEFPNYKIHFLDVPYLYVPVVYNVRQKRSIKESNLPLGLYSPKNLAAHPKSHPDCGMQDGESVSKYYVENKKLFTCDGKQIKVWHYLAHFGIKTEGAARSDCNKLYNWDAPSDAQLEKYKKTFCDMVNSYIHDGIFNQETKDFFRDECDCGTFFHEEFTL